jgi:hypothetical protein
MMGFEPMLVKKCYLKKCFIAASGRSEEEEIGFHSVPRLSLDLAPQGKPRRELQDRHGGRHLASRH